MEGDLEFLYSEQNSAYEETAFALQNSTSSEESVTESEDEYFHVYSFKEIDRYLSTSQPCVEVHILPSKFSHPKKVIAYMDTSAQKTMMNPKILPTEHG